MRFQSALPKGLYVSLRFLARVLYYGYYLACPFIDVMTWFMWWDRLLDGESTQRKYLPSDDAFFYAF